MFTNDEPEAHRLTRARKASGSWRTDTEPLTVPILLDVSLY